MRILWANDEPAGGPAPEQGETLLVEAEEQEDALVESQEKSPEKGQKGFG